MIKEIWFPNFEDKRMFVKIKREFSSFSEILSFGNLESFLKSFEPYLVKTTEFTLYPNIYEFRIFITGDSIGEKIGKELIDKFFQFIGGDKILDEWNAVKIMVMKKENGIDVCEFGIYQNESAPQNGAELNSEFLEKPENLIAFKNSSNSEEFEKIKEFVREI
jgi:hypothetical protein